MKAFLDALEIREAVGLEKWSEDNIFLTSDFVSKAGRFSLKKITPYMSKIYADLSLDSPVEEVTMICGAQTGKTQALLNSMLYYQCTSPGPSIFITATQELSVLFAKQRLQPMIENCRAAKRALKTMSGRSASDTILLKLFYGGSLALFGGQSRQKLSSLPCRYLFIDELDRMKTDLQGEGDALELAKKRTVTYKGRRKLIYASTPTIKGMSRIEASFDESRRHRFYCPCPFCGHFQILVIDNLQPSGKYECANCNTLIDDREHKEGMLSEGQWRTEDPPGLHHGYHLSQLSAPYLWATWKEIADQEERTKDSPERRVAFTNLVLGESYEEIGTGVDASEIRRKFTLDYGNEPWQDTIALTAAADIQGDRVEICIYGWLPKMCSYLLDHIIIMGKLSSNEVQDQILRLYDKEFKRPDMTGLRIGRFLIDSGFDTTSVYALCARRINMLPVKGKANLDSPFSTPRYIESSPATKRVKKHGGTLVFIGTDILKSEVYSSLGMSEEDRDDPNTWRKVFFPRRLSDEFFEQLAAERLVSERGRGQDANRVVKRWRLTRRRNEALDLIVYARSAAYMLGLHEALERRREQRKKKKVKKKKVGKKKEVQN